MQVSVSGVPLTRALCLDPFFDPSFTLPRGQLVGDLAFWRRLLRFHVGVLVFFVTLLSGFSSQAPATLKRLCQDRALQIPCSVRPKLQLAHIMPCVNRSDTAQIETLTEPRLLSSTLLPFLVWGFLIKTEY